MRAALRYYVEAFRLPAVTGEQVDSRVRFEGAMPQLKAHLLAGRPVLAFLGHTGNWDLAGVWCARHLGTVVTVAERLEPEEMFRAFLDYRESLGMVIHPAEHGTFARLREQLATGEPVVMPLLADRDLSATGVEVDLCGHRARMAAGPAALAVETGLPLYPVTLRHERLGRTWGMVVTIHDAVDVPSAECADAVARTTQACADSFGRAITEHTEDWHMMQRVFVEDLDPARDAERRRAA
ncbi:phosphatidylinositol mannoside acyltransferase [Janibacter hoylei]|uniref:phosphatidylinositol mannoside acyltransferase n=1 Tax=Janibacter hoylei TaxID=364298 RepID=UPI00389AA6AD